VFDIHIRPNTWVLALKRDRGKKTVAGGDNYDDWRCTSKLIEQKM